MAKRLPNVQEFERKHNESIQSYINRVKRLYNKAAVESARVAMGLKQIKPGQIFSFSQYPELTEIVDRIFKEMHDGILQNITTASRYSWYLANVKSDQLVKAVLSDEALKKDIVQKYFSTNQDALKAFQVRKVAGMNLSDRVWKLTESHKNQIEIALDHSIGTGRSAANTARDVQQFLNEPDKLFRRVRDKHGELKLSKAARDYHPGIGTYRSSFMNAKRLTTTEINMSYRNAEQLRYDSFDFVVGKKIVRSNNPVYCPVCSKISDQIYPKSYIFSGFHPFCRCFTITILMTDEEIESVNDAILNDEPLPTKSVNTVTKMPDAFNQYLIDNKPALLRLKNTPYYLKENGIKLG